jgi:hypothetical protein
MDSPAYIEQCAGLIDNPGRAHIQQVLRTHNNPAQALIELQQTLGLKYSANIGRVSHKLRINSL